MAKTFDTIVDCNAASVLKLADQILGSPARKKHGLMSWIKKFMKSITLSNILQHGQVI